MPRTGTQPIVAALVAVAALTACREDPAGLPQPGDRSQVAPALEVPTLAFPNTWNSPLANMPTPRMDLVASSVNGLIYAIGGRNDHFGVFSAVEAYTPNITEFGPLGGSWASKAPLPSPRWGANGGHVINGKIHVVGGSASTVGNANLSEKTLFVYNPVTNTWTTKAPMPIKTCCGASAVIGDKLYVLTPAFLNGTARLHRYNPATNTWVQRANPPHDHSRPAGGVINGKFYVVGGQNGALGPTKFLDVYDPATNTWVSKAAAPTARYAAAGRVISSKFYVVGGRPAADTPLNKVEVYNPATNTWTTKTPMPTARYLLAAAQSNGFLFAIGGWRPVPYDFHALATNEGFTP